MKYPTRFLMLIAAAAMATACDRGQTASLQTAGIQTMAAAQTSMGTLRDQAAHLNQHLDDATNATGSSRANSK